MKYYYVAYKDVNGEHANILRVNDGIKNILYSSITKYIKEKNSNAPIILCVYETTVDDYNLWKDVLK